MCCACNGGVIRNYYTVVENGDYVEANPRPGFDITSNCLLTPTITAKFLDDPDTGVTSDLPSWIDYEMSDPNDASLPVTFYINKCDTASADAKAVEL